MNETSETKQLSQEEYTEKLNKEYELGVKTFNQSVHNFSLKDLTRVLRYIIGEDIKFKSAKDHRLGVLTEYVLSLNMRKKLDEYNRSKKEKENGTEENQVSESGVSANEPVETGQTQQGLLQGGERHFTQERGNSSNLETTTIQEE